MGSRRIVVCDLASPVATNVVLVPDTAEGMHMQLRCQYRAARRVSVRQYAPDSYALPVLFCAREHDAARSHGVLLMRERAQMRMRVRVRRRGRWSAGIQQCDVSAGPRAACRQMAQHTLCGSQTRCK
eukprot:292077-Rhodomonas_salina.3